MDDGQKKRAPATPRPCSQIRSDLSRGATVTGAAAANPFPKPTHNNSPVATAHEEQLTSCLPYLVRLIESFVCALLPVWQLCGAVLGKGRESRGKFGKQLRFSKVIALSDVAAEAREQGHGLGILNAFGDRDGA